MIKNPWIGASPRDEVTKLAGKVVEFAETIRPENTRFVIICVQLEKETEDILIGMASDVGDREGTKNVLLKSLEAIETIEAQTKKNHYISGEVA